MADTTTIDQQKNYKESKFDQEFKVLIEKLIAVVSDKFKVDIDYGRKPIQLEQLENYRAVCDQAATFHHIVYFENIFNANRSIILSGSDAWIHDKNIVVQFGEGRKLSATELAATKNIRLELSKIYGFAYDIKRKAEELAKDGLVNPDEQDLIRERILMLHIMRIFYFICDTDDRTSIGKIVTFIENELAVPAEKRSVGKEPWIVTAPQGAIGGLMSMATSLMKSFGIEPQPQMMNNIPSDESVGKIMGDIFQDSDTQETIKKLMSSVDGCNDIGSAFKNIMGCVNDPKMMESIKNTVARTTKIAQENQISK